MQSGASATFADCTFANNGRASLANYVNGVALNFTRCEFRDATLIQGDVAALPLVSFALAAMPTVYLVDCVFTTAFGGYSPLTLTREVSVGGLGAWDVVVIRPRFLGNFRAVLFAGYDKVLMTDAVVEGDGVGFAGTGCEIELRNVSRDSVVFAAVQR